MALVRAQDVTVAFGARPLLDRASFTVNAGDCIGLVGRNGEGKSTLLKLIAGQLDVDGGDISAQSGVRVAYLPQSVPTELSGTVYDTVASGLADTGRLLAEYHRLTNTSEHTDASIARMARVQDAIDAANGWSLEQRVSNILSRMTLDADTPVASLSGGLKRRVLLAQALVSDPDLLLLDEPTNHLDIAAIDWLEAQLASLRCAIMFVTHDRRFLDTVASSIMELDRGRLTEWPNTYARYKELKAQQLEAEATQNALFDKKLAEEEVWIRQGIKARRTRNEGRVRALEAMREKHRERRKQTGQVKLSANQAESSGKRVFVAEQVQYDIGEHTILRNINLTVQRGDRIGIVGPNGCGKSTLLSVLLGINAPTSGSVETGTRVEIAYYDQLRGSLNPKLSAADNVSGGQDTVEFNGAPRHIMSYMQDFLFTPDRARAPITALSGGETGRLLLARLFLQPSNVLVLDEPSNDLDVETLELLEAMLAEYTGTVLLISHDRQLLDNVVTSCLVFQGNGRFVDVVGGYSDFLRELATSTRLRPAFTEGSMLDHSGDAQATNGTMAGRSEDTNDSLTSTQAAAGQTAKNAVKLSYKLKRELDQLPDRIAQLEADIGNINQEMSEPDFYRDADKSAATIERFKVMEAELQAAYERWDELENQQSG